MGEEVEQIKNILVTLFPGLSFDPCFKITSPATNRYNCIAWAYNYNDRCMQYSPDGIGLDDVLKELK